MNVSINNGLSEPKCLERAKSAVSDFLKLHGESIRPAPEQGQFVTSHAAAADVFIVLMAAEMAKSKADNEIRVKYLIEKANRRLDALIVKARKDAVFRKSLLIMADHLAKESILCPPALTSFLLELFDTNNGIKGPTERHLKSLVSDAIICEAVFIASQYLGEYGNSTSAESGYACTVVANAIGKDEDTVIKKWKNAKRVTLRYKGDGQ